MKKRMKKVLGRMFLGCGVVGMLVFGGCEEDEGREVWIEKEKREMTFGAEGGNDTIRVANVAVVDAFSEEYGYRMYPDTTYLQEGKRVVIGNWYRVERSEGGDLLTVQVDSNESEKQRKLTLHLLALAHGDYIQITQEGMEKPVKRE